MTEKKDQGGLCDICKDGKEYKNLGSHKRHCIKKQRETPLKLEGPAPDFRPDQTASDQDKLRAFLSDLPIWSAYKETGIIRKTIRGLLNPNLIMKDIVFVSEDRAPRVCHLPYEPEKNRLIIPGKGFFLTALKGDVFFFHEDYMLPLINAPNLKDRFNIPAHVVAYAYASGIAEGKAQAWKDLLEGMQRWRYVLYAGIGIAILALAAWALSSHEQAGAMKNMAAALANATQAAASSQGVIQVR